MSQINAELIVLEKALTRGSYSYLHLISGQDLPIKSQDYIHEFFSNLVPGTNMVGLAQGNDNVKDVKNKTRYYHFFTSKYRSKKAYMKLVYNIVRKILLITQKFIGIHRHHSGVKIYKGANWVSITQDFAHYIVSNKKWIEHIFKMIPCADEMYKQTLLMNSCFKNTLFDAKKDFAGGTRLIDWDRGKPYTWRQIDIKELLTSDSLFARKFSSDVDRDIIDLVKNTILYTTHLTTNNVSSVKS